MDEQTQASTSAFFTLDAFNGELALQIMNAIEEGHAGNVESWEALVKSDEELHRRLTEQGISKPEEFTSIAWDLSLIHI